MGRITELQKRSSRSYCYYGNGARWRRNKIHHQWLWCMDKGGEGGTALWEQETQLVATTYFFTRIDVQFTI